MFPADDRHVEWLAVIREGLFERDVDNECKQNRPKKRAHEQGRKQGPPIPQVVPHLFHENGAQRIHSGVPARLMALTKASSRSSQPVLFRMPSALSCNATRPSAMITISSQSWATSCMT